MAKAPCRGEHQVDYEAFLSVCKQSRCVAGAVTAAGTAPRTNVETQGIGALRTLPPPSLGLSILRLCCRLWDSGLR